MGWKPHSTRGPPVVPSPGHSVRRSLAPVLLGGAGLLLLAAICVYFRVGLIPSVLIEVLAFGAMREERLRRALAESRDARNELRLAIDTIPTIVWSTSADGTVNFVNRAWRDFTGLSAEHAARGGWLETLHPDEAALVQATRNAAIAAGRPYELDVRLRQADGTYRWVLRRSVPLRDESGRIVQWYGTGTDIDDLKRAEAALRESEAFLAEAQRLSRTGSFGWDLSRSELRWSEETFCIFEYDPAAGAPTIEHVLRRVHPDDLETVGQAIDRVTHDKRDWDLDHRLLMPDGRVKYVHVVARVARHPGGVEFVGAVMDVTATRRAQQAARRAREGALAARFTAALQERTRLAREIHDTLLQGFTGVALQLTAVAHRAADPATAAALGEVIGQAQRTLDEARQAVWDLRAPLAAGATLADALRETAEQAMRGTDLALELEVSGTPYPVATPVEAAVARVLQESITNTVRHAEARSVWVRLRYTPRALRLTVRDDGKGFQVDPEFRGYGGHWGLLGMRERAAELQGSLKVESAPACGTAVALRIPRTIVAAPEE
jgi:PAS domain S-box-containing protein